MVYQWLISKKNKIFQCFRRGPLFSRGGWVQIFPGGGIKMHISIETHRTCDFPVPLPSGSAHATSDFPRNLMCTDWSNQNCLI